MPAIVGIIKVNNVSGSGVFNVGDVYKISPNATARTFAGSGSFNTGDNIRNYNNKSTTQTYDGDFADQNILFNR